MSQICRLKNQDQNTALLENTIQNSTSGNICLSTVFKKSKLNINRNLEI